MSEEVALWLVKPSRWQPRQQFEEGPLVDLARSIQEHGLLNPPIVFPVDGMFELVCGERRSRAVAALALARLFPTHSLEAWVARLATVGLAGMGEEERAALREAEARMPAQIRPAAGPEALQALHLVAVLENMEHSDLTPVEEAQAFQALQQAYGWSQRELAARVNKSQGYVAQRLGLLQTAPEVQAALNTRVITATEARAIAAAPVGLQPALLERADQMTTRQLEDLAHAVKVFLEPQRWKPVSGRYYGPRELNMLAFMRWLVTQVAPTERLLALGASSEGVLSQSPEHFIRFGYSIDQACRAMTGRIEEQVYPEFARAQGRTCETCAWSSFIKCMKEEVAPWVSRKQTAPYFPCPRVEREKELDLCEKWLAPGGRVDVQSEADYEMKALAREQGVTAPVATADYVALYQGYVKQQAKKRFAAGVLPDHVKWIRRYRWALEFVNREWPTHDCARCWLWRGTGCALEDEPIQETWGPRGPYQGVVIAPEGSPLWLRCEGFAFKELPKIKWQPDFRLGNLLEWGNALEWLMAIIYRDPGINSHLGRGPLAWLPWRKKVKAYQPAELKQWLQQQQAAGWLQEQMLPALLTCAVSEVQAYQHSGHIHLYNPMAGQAGWYPSGYALQFNDLFFPRLMELKQWPDNCQAPRVQWVAQVQEIVGE